ncbi:hypothetical protein HMI55_006187, partial [Coelomomyces lativittatus]
MSTSPLVDVESDGEKEPSLKPVPVSSPSEPSDHYLFGNLSDLSDLEEQEISDSELPTFSTNLTTSKSHEGSENHVTSGYDDELEYEGEDLEGGYRSKKPAKKRKTQTSKMDKDSSLILAHVGPEAQERVLAVRKEFSLAMKSITSTRKRQKDTDVM